MDKQTIKWSDVRVSAGGINCESNESFIIIGMMDAYYEFHEIQLTVEQSKALRCLLLCSEEIVKRYNELRNEESQN